MVVTGNRKSLEPWIPDNLEYYDHQIDGIRHLARMSSFLLADEMGLGKTLEALTVFAIDVKMFAAKRAIVVAPVTLKENWADEIEKFTGFKYVIVEGTPLQRRQKILEYKNLSDPALLICNYEQIEGHLRELNDLAFDTAIFDEAHYLKNPKAKRTKACLALFSKRSFILTGSPMLNHVNELWSLLHRIAPRDFPAYWTFLNRYAVFGGYKDKQIIGIKNEKELTEKLQGVMLRRLAKDVLNLKEPQIIQVKIDLHPEQRRLYDQIVEEMRLDLPGYDDPMEIENALTKFLRLKQICGTTATIEGYKDNSYKLDRVVEMIEELRENGHRVVVFTQFRGVLAALDQRLSALNPDYPVWLLHGDIAQSDRVPTIKDWATDPDVGVLACMVQVAGVGLNMTAARHCIFIDKLFVPKLNEQAIARLNRIGQDETQPVQVYEMICKNTIESRIEQILRTKDKLFRSIVEQNDWKKRLVRAVLGRDED